METSSNNRHHTVNPIPGDDDKFKDSGVPQATSQHSYSSENVILRKDIPRPCAVIGPGVIPPYRVDGYMPHIWPQSNDGSSAYYRHPQVQFCSDRAYPPRNISPRHTFQENMHRIIFPSPSEAKYRNYSAASQSGPAVLPESSKPNILPDAKFCDESVLVNPRSVDLIRSQYNRSNDVPLRHEVQGTAVPQYAVHGYPVNKIHNASASPYSNVYNYPPEFQRYPLEYQNPGIQLVKNNQIYQKLPEQSSFIVANEYPGSKYSRMSNMRYEPYPPIKDKYVHSRFDYPYTYSNQYPPGYSSIAKCNDLRKRNFIPPDMKYYQMPQKYIEAHTLLPNSDFRPKISARRSQYHHLADIPAHSIDPYAAQGKVYGFNICDKNNQYSVNPRTIPESSKLRLDYYNHYRGLPYPDTQFLNENMQSQSCNKNNMHAYPMKPPDVNNSYLNNVNYQKPGDEQSDRVNEYDAGNNQKFYYNPLAKIPTEFSPNIISPTESSTSFDSLHTISHQLYQEDGGYVSQCSTTSGKSADYQLIKNSNDKQLYHDSNRRGINMVNFSTSNNPEKECDKSSIKSRSMKSSMDLRQFLEMWDEEFEDSKVVKTHSEANNKTDNGYANCTQYVPDNPMLPLSEQLYVLDKVNIADGDLHKYEHLQKVTELPGNIKDCDQADNIKKTISKLNRQSATNNNPLHHLNVKKDKLNSNVKPTYDLQESMYNIPTNELVDVEAKISQSIIHKDVGCNFEIKPCSPGRPVQMKIEIQHDFNNHSIDVNKKANHTNKMQTSEFVHIYESKEKVLKNNSNSNNKIIVDLRNSPFMPVNDFTVRKTCCIDTPLPSTQSPVALTEHSPNKNLKKSLCANENRETVLHKTNYDANRKIEKKSEPSKSVISSTLGTYKENSLIEISSPNVFHLEKNNELTGVMEFKNIEKKHHKSQEEIDVGIETCPKGYEGFLEKLKLKTNKVLGNIYEGNQLKPDGISEKNKEIRNYDPIISPLKNLKKIFEPSDSKMDCNLSKELTKIGEDNLNVSDIVKVANTIDFDNKAKNSQLRSQKLDIPEELEALNLSPKEEEKFKDPEDKVVKENKKSPLMSEKLHGPLNFVNLPNIHTDSENTEGMVLMEPFHGTVPCSIKTHQILKSTLPIPDKSTQPIIDIYKEKTENIASCLTVLDKAHEVASASHIMLGKKFTVTDNLSLNIQESKLSEKADTLPSVDNSEIRNCNMESHNRPILNVCLGDTISINTNKECDLLSKLNPSLESSYLNYKERMKQSCDEGILSPKNRVEKDNGISHIKTSIINVIECDKIDQLDTSGVSVIKDTKSNLPFASADIKVNNEFEKKIDIQDVPLPAEKIEKSRSSVTVSKQENVINIMNTRNDSDNNIHYELDLSTSYDESELSDVILKPHSIHIEETSMEMMSGRRKEYKRHESFSTKISNNLNNLDFNTGESANNNKEKSKTQDVIPKPDYIHIEGVEKNVSGKLKKIKRYSWETCGVPDSDLNKNNVDPKESTSYNEDVISKPQLVHNGETEGTLCRIQEKTTCTLNHVDDSESESNNLYPDLKKPTDFNINEAKIRDLPSKLHLIDENEVKETKSDGIKEKIICAYNSIEDSVSNLNNLDSNPDKSLCYIENKTIIHNEILKPHSEHIQEVDDTMCDGVQENETYTSNSIEDSDSDLNNIESNPTKSINYNESESTLHNEILKLDSIHNEEAEDTLCDGILKSTIYAHTSNSIEDSDSDLNNIESNPTKSINYNERESTLHNEILKLDSIHNEEAEDTLCDGILKSTIYAHTSNSIEDSDSDLNNIESNPTKSINYNERESTLHNEILKLDSIHNEEAEDTLCDGILKSTIYASNSNIGSNSILKNLDFNPDKSSLSYNENETMVHDKILKPHLNHIEEIVEVISGTQEDYTLNNLDFKPDESKSFNENKTKMPDICLKSHPISVEETAEIISDRCTSNLIDTDNKINSLLSNQDEFKSEIIMQDIIIKPHLIHIEEVEEITSDSLQKNERFNHDSDLNDFDSNPDDSTSCIESEAMMRDINLKPYLIQIEGKEESTSDEIQENVSNPVDDSDNDLNNLDFNSESTSYNENEKKIRNVILNPNSIPNEVSEETVFDRISENITYASNIDDDCNLDKLTNIVVSKTQMKDVINIEGAMYGIKENTKDAPNVINDPDKDAASPVSNTEESTSYNVNERITQDVLLKQDVMHIEEAENTMSGRKKEETTNASKSTYDSIRNLSNFNSNSNNENKSQMQDIISKSHLIHTKDKKNATNKLNPIHDSDSQLDKVDYNIIELASYNENKMKTQGIIIKSHLIHVEETEGTISDRPMENIRYASIARDSDTVDNIDSNPDEPISSEAECEIRKPDVILKPKITNVEKTGETTPNISNNIQKDVKYALNSINDSKTDPDSKQNELTCYNIPDTMNITEDVISKQALYINDAEYDISQRKYGKLESIGLNPVLNKEFNNDLNSLYQVPSKSENYTNELTGITSENDSDEYKKYKSFKKKDNDCEKMYQENKKLALIHSNHEIKTPSPPQYFEETDSSLILSGDIECRKDKSLSPPSGDALVSVDHAFNVEESEDIINRTDTLLEISILETRKEICISNIENIVLGSQLQSIELSVQSDPEDLDEIVSANESVLLYEIQSPVSPQCDAVMENVVNSDIVESLYVTNSTTYNEGDIVENNTSALNEVLEDPKIDENIVELGGCWIEDIACVETVISEETIFQSEDEIATVASPEISWGPNTSDSEADESVPYSIQHKLNCTEEIFKDSNSNFILKNCKLELFKLPDEYEEDECHGLQSFTEIQSKKTRCLKSLDVSSSDSTKKRNHPTVIIHDREKNKINRKKIKLDDTNLKETMVSKCVEKIQKIPSLNTRSNLFSKGKLITKGAQKYIPPEDTYSHKLKCQLPLPENILMSLSKHNLRNARCNESRHKTNIKVDKHTRSQNNKLPKKIINLILKMCLNKLMRLIFHGPRRN